MDTPAGPRPTPLHHPRWASTRSMKVSPAKKLLRTNGTVRSTLGLSVGVRTRAGSTRKPLAWAYSTNAWFKRGSMGSALVTTVPMLSGITTLNTPAEKGPGRLEPLDHRLDRLGEAEPHETVPGVTRR